MFDSTFLIPSIPIPHSIGRPIVLDPQLFFKSPDRVYSRIQEGSL